MAGAVVDATARGGEGRCTPTSTPTCTFTACGGVSSYASPADTSECCTPDADCATSVHTYATPATRDAPVMDVGLCAGPNAIHAAVRPDAAVTGPPHAAAYSERLEPGPMTDAGTSGLPGPADVVMSSSVGKRGPSRSMVTGVPYTTAELR